ncbi:hypothetical protein [Sandaracinus amylolyticus]|nr:hypothetical protein [Sandaracinus amylolyticus]
MSFALSSSEPSVAATGAAQRDFDARDFRRRDPRAQWPSRMFAC